MTTIIRSNVTLSSPQPGSVILPALGVSGITHRWSAEHIEGKPGAVVERVPDAIGGVELAASGGTAILRQSASGKRFIDLSSEISAGATYQQNRLVGGASSDSNVAFTLAGIIYWEKISSGQSYGVLNTSNSPSTQALSLDAQNGRISCYAGNSGVIISTGPTTKTGWHTCTVSYKANGEEVLCLDNGAIVRGEVHTTTAGAPITAVSINSFGISGRPDTKVKVSEYAFINHALTDAEIRAAHTAMAKLLPE